MSNVSALDPATFKRPKFFAIRRFPEGCGRLVVFFDADDFLFDGVLTPSESETEPSEEIGSFFDRIGSLEPDEVDSSKGIADRVGFPDSKSFILPKRRRRWAFRAFPTGCGRTAPKLSETRFRNVGAEIGSETSERKLGGNERETIEENSGIEEKKEKGFENNRNQVERSVEVCGDRLIVQALMAAPNCPWRQKRKRKVKTMATKGRNSRRKQV